MAINPRTENLQHKLTTYIPLVIPSQEKKTNKRDKNLSHLNWNVVYTLCVSGFISFKRHHLGQTWHQQL